METYRLDSPSGGYIKGHFDFDTDPAVPFFYLHKINVPEHSRGKGVGTALMHELLVTCVSRNINEIYGWLCSDDMEAEARFYQRFGFEIAENEHGDSELYPDLTQALSSV